MENKTARIVLLFAVLLGVSIACNVPKMTPPTPILFPTVDYTLTAIFSTVYPQVTETQPMVVIVTSTPVQVTATETMPPPTNTLEATPTRKAKPTNTPKKPVSYEGPSKRGTYTVKINYFDTPPTIDGSFDEWNEEKYIFDYVVYGEDQWSGVEDCSGNFMMGWDKKALYIAARIKDDVYRQGATGKNLFRGDSLEVLIDTKVSADYYLAELSGDDYQLGISPGNPSPGTGVEAYLWFPRNLEGYVDGVKISAVETADGYRVEVKIPWSIFNINPNAGNIYGFALSVSDNDRSAKNEQQTMISNVKTRRLTNPMTWGDLILNH